MKTAFNIAPQLLPLLTPATHHHPKLTNSFSLSFITKLHLTFSGEWRVARGVNFQRITKNLVIRQTETEAEFNQTMQFWTLVNKLQGFLMVFLCPFCSLTPPPPSTKYYHHSYGAPITQPYTFHFDKPPPFPMTPFSSYVKIIFCGVGRR